MPLGRRSVFLAAAASFVVLAAPSPGAQVASAPASSERPRLVVLLVVDQFPVEYVDLYGGAWTGGLHTLLTRGSFFANAAYAHGRTTTCAGHATISTGSHPSTSGMIDNEWFDPATRAFTTCTADPSATPLAYGGRAGTEQHSARWLRAPTFVDELVRQSGGRSRVVSMSLKARSAIMLGGRGGPSSTIVWAEDTGGAWITSSALTRRRSPAVEAFVRANPVDLVELQTWNRAAPEAVYQFDDRGAGEPSGTATFPHLLDEPIRTARTTPALIDSWEVTPFSDAYLARLATHLLSAEQLGQQAGRTDYLAISFSALDYVGHRYGPRSHEVQDTLYRLDRVLATLLGTLDMVVGRERYVLALSSDHGVAPMPEQTFGRATDANAPQEGRTTLLAIGTAVEDMLDARLGRGSYVEAAFGGYLYFRRGVLDRIKADPDLERAVESALRTARGVAHVYWSTDLAQTTSSADPILTAMRKSYFPGRSGDLMFVLKPNWVTSTDAAHGSPHDYDRRVPVIFFGGRIPARRLTTNVTPADIAPTLAALTGVQLAKTDGRSLSEVTGR